MDSPKADSTFSPIQVSLRDRLFAVLTANMAVAFALVGWFGSQQYVHKVNFLRILEVDMLRVKSRILTTRSGVDPQQDKQRELDGQALEEQIGIAWLIARVWEYLMYAAAVILEITAVMSAAGRHGRRAHLVAGWAVLVCTLLTLLAMALLVSPSFGGMKPLPIRYYVYIALLQGGYGAVLLAVFRDWQRPATH